MRIVVFTSRAEIEASAWWPVLLATPGLEAILVYRQRPPGRKGAARRFVRNVRKHGLLWVPYRAGSAAIGVLAALRRGRGAPLHAAARAVPLEVIETDALKRPETLARVAAWGPDLGVSLGAPIMKPEVFELPRRGTINLHEGKVPDYRGAPPAFWELVTGASEIGATVHWVDAGLDTGRVIRQATAPLYAEDSLRTAEARAEELGRLVLAGALEGIALGDGNGRVQPTGGRTYRMPLLEQRMALAARLGARRVRRALTPREIAKTVASLAVLGCYRPVRDAVRTVLRRHPVRVFNFHRITHLCRDGMTVAPDVFARQVAYVSRHHDLVSPEHGLALIRSGARLKRPAAFFTFDDGYASVYDVARPVLERFGAVGGCFVPTARIGTADRLAHDDGNPVPAACELMSWEQVRDLRHAGWTVGAHSATHARLSELSGDALREEVVQPLVTLKERLCLGAVTVAYPYGRADDISAEGRDAIRAAGYAACFSGVFGENGPGSDLYDLRRIDIGGGHRTLAWKRMAHGLKLRRRGRR